MYDENQLITVRWNNTNKNWYESKGYIFTKRNEEFQVKIKDLSVSSKIKIKVICDYCSNEYETQYSVIVNGRKAYSKDACPHCASKKVNDKLRNKRAEKYIGLAKEVCENRGYILLTTVDDYIDIKMNADFICPKHGKQTMVLDNLIRGYGCNKCAYEDKGKRLRHDIEYVIDCIENVNGNKLLNPEDYKDAVTRNLNILCSCGNTFTTSFVNYTKHGVDTCYSCSCKESIGEEQIRKYLDENKIKYIQEKRFVDCRDNKPLPFDFYLEQYNLIIEFDGKQHFEPRFGKESFIQTQKHDEIKNQYCQSRGINLLRIPYWEGHNIEKIISKQLNL